MPTKPVIFTVNAYFDVLKRLGLVCFISFFPHIHIQAVFAFYMLSIGAKGTGGSW
jgi:hypothetical protein